MLQIEPFERRRDRVPKLVAPTDAARLPHSPATPGDSALVEALGRSAAGGPDAGVAARVAPTRSGATTLRYAIEPRPEQYLG